jgi:hypothetical protein
MMTGAPATATAAVPTCFKNERRVPPVFGTDDAPVSDCPCFFIVPFSSGLIVEGILADPGVDA